MIKNLFLSYKERYDALGDKSQKIVKLLVVLSLTFIVILYLYMLHYSLDKNNQKIQKLKQDYLTVNNLSKTIKSIPAEQDIKNALEQNNFLIKKINYNTDNLKLEIIGDFSKFIIWLQSTNFKIQDINIIKQDNNFYITSTLTI